jgi:periplasmic protein TonB
MVVLCLVVSVLGVGAVAFVRGILSGTAPQTKKVVQEIHVIRPPPPPPDLPPPPPPPPEEKVDVSEPKNEPDPTPSNEPPPSEQLGLDADGSAGGDAFGLAAHKGGRDLLASGGNAYAWYGGVVKNEIAEQLQNEKKARGGGYSVVLRVWVHPDGSIDRVRITQSSGNPERDRVIESKLVGYRLSQTPPADMPQPIAFRIVSRG